MNQIKGCPAKFEMVAIFTSPYYTCMYIMRGSYSHISVQCYVWTNNTSCIIHIIHIVRCHSGMHYAYGSYWPMSYWMVLISKKVIYTYILCMVHITQSFYCQDHEKLSCKNANVCTRLFNFLQSFDLNKNPIFVISSS